MSQVVFILGAGAARDAGAPLMFDFLDVARDLWNKNLVQESDLHFSNVFKAISTLQQVHSKALLDFHNLESVFSAFEMAGTLQKFSNYNSDEITALQKSMKVVIARTIERTLKFKIRGEGFLDLPTNDYYRLIILVSKLSEMYPPKRVTVITFNYDLSLDVTFEHFGPVFYALERENKSSKSVSLLKLHGSLNWGKCSGCNSAVAIRDISKRTISRPAENALVQISLELEGMKHTCGANFLSEPILIPPTFSKSEHHHSLTSVWQQAARELTDAEDIFVLGYSMPESDYFFRNLYALGTVGEKLIRRFWVFDPDNLGEVQARFRRLLGPGAIQRFRFYQERFGDGIKVITEEYGISSEQKGSFTWT